MMKRDVGIAAKHYLLVLMLIAVLMVVFSASQSIHAQGTTFTVNITADVNDGACSVQHCSLREAIIAANGAPGSTVNIPAGTYTLSIAGSSEDSAMTGDLDITANMTVSGAGEESTIITQESIDRLFHIIGTHIVTISGLTLQNGAGLGGAISSGGTLTITDCILKDNHGAIGGALLNSITADENGTCDASCSLREAIIVANASPDTSTITFNITPGGAKTIQPVTSLPEITAPIIIDGTTQPGYAGAPIIELNGSLAGEFASGLNLSAGGSIIRSLVINGWDMAGISLTQNGGNSILGNYLGTNLQGTAAKPNKNGIMIYGSDANTIGDGTPTGRNVISGNSIVGISLGGGNHNQIIGNYIGPDANGAALGNGMIGIDAAGDMIFPITSALIGGSASQGNVIAYNGGPGVGVQSDFTQGVTITGNAIYANQQASPSTYGPGIDLLPEGVTANDDGDTDTGANNLQNFPVLSAAKLDNGTLTLTGTLDTSSNQPFHLEFFANDTCDPSGYGEGQVYLGAADVVTDANGASAINVALTSMTVAVGQSVTATATDHDGNTSEFSACVLVESSVSKPSLVQPENHSTSTNRQPTFQWEAVPDAIGYELSLGCTNPPQEFVTVTGTTYTPSTPLLYDTYFWRVRVSGAGEDGWSDTWSVTIAAPLTAAPERNLFTISTPTLYWSPVIWAVAYEIQISSDPVFGSAAVYYLRDEVDGNEMKYTVPSGVKALTDGVYYWRVRAKNARGVWGRWSATDRFIVEVP